MFNERYVDWLASSINQMANFLLNISMGRNYSLDDLREGFDFSVADMSERSDYLEITGKTKTNKNKVHHATAQRFVKSLRQK